MLMRSAAVVVFAFSALNLATSWLVATTGTAQRPVEIQTRATYQARLGAFFEQPAQRRCVVLGDSLVFGAQLATKLGQSWPEHTLSARFQAAARSAGQRYTALNLGVNGVLFSELRCMLRDVLERRPELLLINVSPRPFSADFRVPAHKTERAFLCPARGSRRDWLDEQASTQLRARLPILRYRDLLQFAWLGSTPRERALGAIDGWLGRIAPAPGAEPQAEDEDEAELAEIMREMAWRTKAAARYNAIEVTADHPQAAELTGMLRLLAQQRATRVVLFYLKENVAPLKDHLDAAHYQEQTAKFVELVQQKLAGSAVRFVVVPSEPFAQHYTDHIHLDAQGYELLARTLLGSARE